MPAVTIGVVEGATTGWGQDISADGRPEMAFGGISVAWDTVAALAAPVTLPDGTVYAVGEKVLFPGQVMMEITAAGANVRMFGPYDPAAADGRQTVPAAGVNCGLVRKPVLYQPTLANRFYDSFIGLVIGGPVVRDMVRAHPTTPSLAAGPLLTALLAALPRLVLVGNLRGSHT